jgi:hypothetical protein
VEQRPDIGVEKPKKASWTENTRKEIKLILILGIIGSIASDGQDLLLVSDASARKLGSDLGDEGLVDVRNDSSSSNGGLDQGVKFLVSSDGKLQMSGGNSLDFQVLAGVSCQLKHLSSEILKNSSAIYSSGRTNSMVCIHSQF